MKDEGREAMEALVQSQEEYDAEEGRKLMAQWMKRKLDSMCMHPHQRNTAPSLTLHMLRQKEVN